MIELRARSAMRPVRHTLATERVRLFNVSPRMRDVSG
jgi:hypothetical protein